MAQTKKKKPVAKPVSKKTTKSKQPAKKVTKTAAKTAKPKKTVELSYYMKRKLRLAAEAAEKAKKKPQKTKNQKSKKQGKPKAEKKPVIKKVSVKQPTKKLLTPKKVEQPPTIVVERTDVVSETVAPTKNIYLSNKELLAEVKNSKVKGEMTNKLARMLQMLCSKYAKKGNFVNYSYNEDMQAYAMMMLVRTWDGFKPEVSTNAFAWYTQCIKNSFIQYLKQEKRQRDIRDELLVDQGLTPSFGFGEKDENDAHNVEDEEDFHAQKTVADQLAQLPSEEVSVDEQPNVDDTTTTTPVVDY